MVDLVRGRSDGGGCKGEEAEGFALEDRVRGRDAGDLVTRTRGVEGEAVKGGEMSVPRTLASLEFVKRVPVFGRGRRDLEGFVELGPPLGEEGMDRLIARITVTEVKEQSKKANSIVTLARSP